MITDIYRVHFTPAMLQAAWDARIAHFADVAKRISSHAQILLVFQHLAELVRASEWATRLHPGPPSDGLQIHPCSNGQLDMRNYLTVKWTGDTTRPYSLSFYVATPGSTQSPQVLESLSVSEDELEARFWAMLTSRFAAEDPESQAFPSPRITQARPKRLVGKRLRMSRAEDMTSVLFRSFMPLRHKIADSIGTDLYLLSFYPEGYFEAFDPSVEFEKWAAVEVAEASDLADGLEAMTLAGGLYAVFHYVGPNTDHRIYQFIYGEWLPQSGYVLDARPHFDVLGEKYRNNDPLSEEEIWIPIRSI